MRVGTNELRVFIPERFTKGRKVEPQRSQTDFAFLAIFLAAFA
jgi:hypothetical protein